MHIAAAENRNDFQEIANIILRQVKWGSQARPVGLSFACDRVRAEVEETSMVWRSMVGINNQENVFK